MPRYDNKHVAVIGGTHGMGLATARLMKLEGASVLVTGQSTASVQAAREHLGDDAIVLESDVTKPGEIDALAETIEKHFGALDVLFLSAGISRSTTVHDTSPEIFDEVFDVNTKGAYFTAQKLAPLVRPGGSFVFTTSVAAEAGIAGMGPYSAAKAAVRSFARTYAAELAPRGIRVNVVSPGYTDTPTMGVTGVPAEVLAEFKAAGDEITPLKRHATAGEVAAAVLFLAFEATFTTGADLPVDGGLGQRLTLPA